MEDENKINSFDLNITEKEMHYLCLNCFEVLEKHLNKKTEEIPFPEKFINKSFPLFVTWKKGPEKSLRGCIGTFSQGALESNLPKYALIAALNDPRFSPISKKELPELQVGVSLLVNFESVNHPLDWEVGKHGIEIDFTEKSKSYRGTFLPEVAYEQGWDQDATLNYLVKKAGFNGKWSNVADRLKVVRYQSLKTFLSYAQFIAMKTLK